MSIFRGRLSRKNFGLGVLLTSGVPFLLWIIVTIVLVSSLNSARLEVQDLNMRVQEKAQQMEEAYQENVSIPESEL